MSGRVVDGGAPPPPAAIAAVTKAVVASWVVAVPAVGVGATGVPVNAGDATGARPSDEISMPWM